MKAGGTAGDNLRILRVGDLAAHRAALQGLAAIRKATTGMVVPAKRVSQGSEKRGTVLERNVPLGLLKQQFQGKLNLP